MKKARVIEVAVVVMVVIAAAVTQPVTTPMVPTGDEGNIDLGLKVFRELVKKGNVIVPPASSWASMLMAYLGSNAITEEQLENLVHVHSRESVIEILGHVEEWDGPDPVPAPQRIRKGYHLNRFFVDKDLSMNTEILYLLAERIRTIDSAKPEEVAYTINYFIRNVTQGVFDTIGETDFTKKRKMILTDVGFTHGHWKYLAEDSIESVFLPFDQPAAYVKMIMFEELMSIGFSPLLRATVVKVPLTYSRLNFFVVLPEGIGDVSFRLLVEKLNLNTWTDLLGRMELVDLQVAIPIFTMTASYEGHLGQIMAKHGATDAFDPEKADFSLFADELYAKKTYQKVFVNVTKKDVDMASVSIVDLFSTDEPKNETSHYSVTGNIMTTCNTTFHFEMNKLNEPSENTKNPLPNNAGRSGTKDKPYIAMNRPFLFVIYQEVTNIMMYVGAVLNPTN